MHCSIQRHTNGTAWLRLLARSVLGVGLSVGAIACSGDVESGAEPEDENLPLEGMPPAMNNMGADGRGSSPADSESGEDEIPSNEGAPNASGLDGEGTAEDTEAGSDATEAEAEEMPVVPVESLEVPVGDYCEAVADWDPEWVQFEEEVLLLVNEFRSEPADCGVEGQFAAAPALSMDPILRCSARLHSLDMFERDYFAHDNLDGLDPFQRMDAAGFQGGGGGENIALGQQTPEEVMQAWMDSDGHCANVMRGSFNIIGIGYHPGAGQRGLGSNYWTQNFGAPAPMRGGGRAR